MNTRARLAARLAAAEAARGRFHLTFRTQAGGSFTLPVGDVLAATQQALTWLCDGGTPPAGRTIERLAAAELGEGTDLITRTAVSAARNVVNGVRPWPRST